LICCSERLMETPVGGTVGNTRAILSSIAETGKSNHPC
jgi:hypothetical protein